MEIKDIERAALAYAEENRNRQHNVKEFSVVDFIEGAKWRINSVWHDREVIPEFIEKELLIMFCDNSCMIISLASHWCDFLENNKFVKWAYVDDLLPIK